MQRTSTGSDGKHNSCVRKSFIPHPETKAWNAAIWVIPYALCVLATGRLGDQCGSSYAKRGQCVGYPTQRSDCLEKAGAGAQRKASGKDRCGNAREGWGSGATSFSFSTWRRAGEAPQTRRYLPQNGITVGTGSPWLWNGKQHRDRRRNCHPDDAPPAGDLPACSDDRLGEIAAFYVCGSNEFPPPIGFVDRRIFRHEVRTAADPEAPDAGKDRRAACVRDSAARARMPVSARQLPKRPAVHGGRTSMFIAVGHMAGQSLGARLSGDSSGGRLSDSGHIVSFLSNRILTLDTFGVD
jgi:hypothetical protein